MRAQRHDRWWLVRDLPVGSWAWVSAVGRGGDVIVKSPDTICAGDFALRWWTLVGNK